MKIDLSDLIEDDTVFLINEGHVKIKCIVDSMIHLSCGSTVFKSGKEYDPEDAHPVCFHSIEECIEYFQSVKKEMDEANKPKKRYWLWSLCPKGALGYFFKINIYLDDNGCSSSNYKPYDEVTWDDSLKIKHENEFIEV